MTAPTIAVEPIDDRQCAFRVDPVPGEPAVVEALLAVDGVCEVAVDGNRVVVVRDREGPSWDDVIPRVEYALTTSLAAPADPAPPPASGPSDDDQIYDAVTHIFESQINPIVAQHGGAIDLIDVQDATVVVRMSGGCQGCGMANVTLRQGIEAALRRSIPGLAGIRDITDHASGTNPYFAASSK